MNLNIVQPASARRDIRQLLSDAFAALFERTCTVYLKHANLFGVASIILFAVVVVVMAQLRPGYNWDSLAYLALAARDQFPNISDLHAYTYGLHQAALPPEQFTALAEGDGFRLRQFSDPEAFGSMLGMYEVKWLYVWLLKVMSPIFGPFGAAQAINASAMAILAASLSQWLREARLLAYAPLVICMLFLLQLSTISASPIPDFLTNALAIAALLNFERGRNLIGSILMILAVMTRPDQAAMAGVLMAAAWVVRDRSVWSFTLAFAATLVVWVILRTVAPGVGWWPHVWFSTYSMPDTMVGFHPDFSLQVYLTGFGYNLYRSMFENTWLAAYVLALAWAAWLYAKVPTNNRRQMLLLALLLVIPAKFVIFPLHVGRLYLAPLAVFFMVALAVQVDFWRTTKLADPNMDALGKGAGQ